MKIFLVEGVLILAVLSVVFIVCCIALEIGSEGKQRKVGIFVCFLLSFICIASSSVLYGVGRKELADVLSVDYSLDVNSSTLTELYDYHSFGKKDVVTLSDKNSDEVYTYYIEQKYGKLYFYTKTNGVYEEVDLKR